MVGPGDVMAGRLAQLTVLVVCLTGVATAQIVAPAGRTLFNRAVMFRTFVRVDNFSKGPTGEGRRRIVNAYALVWGAYPHLSMSFVAPLVSVRSDAPGFPGRNLTTTSLADGAVFARYDLLRKSVPGGYTRLSPEIGVRVPTGGTLGTGATEPVGALIFSHVRDPHWLIADAQFTYATTNSGGMRRGNRWKYDIAYLHRLLPRKGQGIPALYSVLEMNGEHVRRSRLNGIQLTDSGGNLLFLSPGIEFIPNRRFVVEFSLPLPVGRDLNGNQMNPSVSFLAGIRWLF